MGNLDGGRFLPTFLSMKLLVFALISYLKTLILLKDLQSKNLHNFYVWLPWSPILYLTVYFTSKLMVQQWDHLLDIPLLTYFCHTMKKNWFNSCAKGFKLVFRRRYVDDIFALFK